MKKAKQDESPRWMYIMRIIIGLIILITTLASIIELTNYEEAKTSDFIKNSVMIVVSIYFVLTGTKVLDKKWW